MKVKNIVVAIALTGLAVPSLAREAVSVEENRGAVSGILAGAAIAGPVGAGVGAILGGGIIGKALGSNRLKNEKIAELSAAADAQKYEKEQLEQAVADLSRDLDQIIELRSIDSQRPDVPIQFRTGSAAIEPHYQSQLIRIAKVLSRNPDASITLSGFADRRGNASANQRLSQKRVNQVEKFLVSRGVSRGQIQTRAYGETQPLQKDESLENNFFDRRVVMELTFDMPSNLATR